jgi:hypothetical protein
MAIARMRQIDASVARWYHCMTRCLRRAFLLGEGTCDRKAWIENRIEDLSQIFAVAVGGFSVMTNHLHVPLRLDPTVADGWSDEDRRMLDSSREGMLEGFSLGSYLLLVDYTGRLFRAGKAAISAELAGILDRLGTNGETWRIRSEKLRAGRLFGRYFAASRHSLREVAGNMGMRSVWNLGGCRVRWCGLELCVIASTARWPTAGP